MSDTINWESDFVLRLRMSNVSGRDIGDALQQVRAHCAESGQTPREAFGDPLAYADSLPLKRPKYAMPSGQIVANAVSLAGFLLATSAPLPLRLGQQQDIRLGTLVGGVLLIVALGVFASSGVRLAVAMMKNLWIFALVWLLVVGLGIAAAMFGGPVVASVPPRVTLVAGCLLLVVGTVLMVRNAPEPDPIESPVGDNTAVRRSSRRFGSLLGWLYPGMAAVTLAVMFLVPA